MVRSSDPCLLLISHHLLCPSTHTAPATLASLQFLKHDRLFLTSELLDSLFPLPGMHFPTQPYRWFLLILQMSVWVLPLQSSPSQPPCSKWYVFSHYLFFPMITLRILATLRICWQCSNSQYSFINCCHYTVHHNPMTLFHNWKFVHFDPLNLLISPTPPSLAITSLFSVSMSLFSSLLRFYLFHTET